MRLLTRDDLRVAQQIAIPHIKENKKCALFAEMGIGKTGATITALVDLLGGLDISRVLIVAPLRVARKTWPDEYKQWKHASWLSYRCLWNEVPGDDVSNANGERRIRYFEAKMLQYEDQLDDLRWDGLDEPKTLRDIRELEQEIAHVKRTLKWGYISARHPEEIHIINRENLAFLVNFWGKFWPYDTIIYDESSGLRNGRKALRWRAMRAVMPFTNRLIELTGTPVPKGLLGLWGQLYLIDGGQRLGTSFTAYKKRFFYQDDYHGYTWLPKPGAEEAIYALISDVCLTLRAADFMDLHDTIYNNIPVVLSDDEMVKYKKLEREYVLELTGGVIEAANSAVLVQKLMQLSNGVVYDSDKKVHVVHNAKADALADYIEEQQGAPVLIAYWFKHDLAVLRKKFPRFKVFADGDDTLTDQWNRGEVPGMFIHPASGGHGLNIQFGGRRILWYGPIHDFELYQQLNARLAGARATGTTFIHHLITEGTADQAIMDSLQEKDGTQNRLLNALRRIAHSCI